MGGSNSSWGADAWNKLHTWAHMYPVSPTQDQSLQAQSDLFFWLKRLPCVHCIQHAFEYTTQVNPISADTFQSRSALERYIFDFHNDVNRRLGKPQYSWKQYQTRMSTIHLPSSYEPLSSPRFRVSAAGPPPRPAPVPTPAPNPIPPAPEPKCPGCSTDISSFFINFLLFLFVLLLICLALWAALHCYGNQKDPFYSLQSWGARN